MIEFDCPHCGNQFRVEEKLAGRHGWCRICKGFIVVPTGHGGARWENLPDEQRVVRLEKILRSTTELYNAQHDELLSLQQAVAQYADDIHKARAAAQELDHVAPRLEQAERDIARLSHDLAQASEAKGAAQAHAEQAERERAAADTALEEAASERDSLAADLARLQERLTALEEAGAERDALESECESLKRRLAERDADLERLHGEAGRPAGAGYDADSLLKQLEEARAARDAALAEQASAEAEARQLEKSLAAASADASRWQSEAERLAQAEQQLAGIQAKWDEAQALIREFHPGLTAAHEARGRADTEAGEAKARAGRLEEQVSRLTEDNEAQREAIAGLRRDAEQARSALKAAEGQAETARDTVQRQEAELARLRDAAVQAAMLQPVTEERDAFRDRLVEAEAQVMRLKEELASFANEAAAGGDGGIGRERDALHTELVRTQQAKTDAQRRGEELTAELREVNAHLEQITAERNRLVEEVTSLQEKGARFDALWSDLANAQARLEESQLQVERLTERLAHAAGDAGYGRGGSAGRTRGYDAPVIPESESRDLTLIPEVVDEESKKHSEELMASMLRFIEPREKGA